MPWQTFSSQSPELADFAYKRLHNKVAYLATIRKDGSPRVHPFTPIIGEVIVTGKAVFLEDEESRNTAVRVCPYTPAERYILFELHPERVTVTEYPDGNALRRHWKINV